MGDRLWAGWRMEFIRRSAEDRNEGRENACLFCGLAEQPPSSENLVVERYRHSFLVLNAFPYTCGHIMVAPLRHHDSFLGKNPEERAEMQAALERVRAALTAEYKPDGFNVGVNLGPDAGAGILGHLHWHMVPRWQGDTNFMPAVAEARVLPEALSQTYARLVQALAAVPETEITVSERGRVL